MNEKYTAKQEKHAKRWRKENEKAACAGLDFKFFDEPLYYRF
jgi:hypothetical protein